MSYSVLNVKALVGAFNQEKALVGAFSVITNLRMELFQALLFTLCEDKPDPDTLEQVISRTPANNASW